MSDFSNFYIFSYFMEMFILWEDFFNRIELLC